MRNPPPESRTPRAALAWLCAAFSLLATACSVERFLERDELLYETSEVEFVQPDAVPDEDALRASLLSQVQQTASGKVGMWWWFKLEHPDSAKGLKPFLRKTLGTAPQYYDEASAEQTELLMADYLKEHG